MTLFAIGLLFWLLCYVTSGSVGGDFFDSPYYWSGWLVLPAATGLIAWLRPRRAHAWFGVVVVTPQAIAVTLLGTVFHDPDRGPRCGWLGWFSWWSKAPLPRSPHWLAAVSVHTAAATAFEAPRGGLGSLTEVFCRTIL